MILCFKNQDWSFNSFLSKVFEPDHELDLKCFPYFLLLLCWLEHWRVKLIFLSKIFWRFFIFSLDFVYYSKRLCSLWVGNRIDELGKMIWSQFSTKVLQITILHINDWDRISVNSQKKTFACRKSLKQNLYLDNQIHMVSIKIPQKRSKEKFRLFSRITKR